MIDEKSLYIEEIKYYCAVEEIKSSLREKRMERLKNESLSPGLKCNPVPMHRRMRHTEQFNECAPKSIFLHSIMLEIELNFIF